MTTGRDTMMEEEDNRGREGEGGREGGREGGEKETYLVNLSLHRQLLAHGIARLLLLFLDGNMEHRVLQEQPGEGESADAGGTEKPFAHLRERGREGGSGGEIPCSTPVEWVVRNRPA